MQSAHRRAHQRRAELKLTQRQVAKACRVTQQAYEKFERGETRRPRYFYELAKALKVSPEWLLTGEQPEVSAASAPPVVTAPERKIPVFTFGDSLNKRRRAYSFLAKEVIDRIRPLPNLEEAADAIALFMQGDDYALSYPHGTIIYLDRTKLPAPRKPCVCIHENGAAILVFISAKGLFYNFKYISSGKPLSIKVSDIKAVYKIAGVTYP